MQQLQIQQTYSNAAAATAAAHLENDTTSSVMNMSSSIATGSIERQLSPLLLYEMLATSSSSSSLITTTRATIVHTTIPITTMTMAATTAATAAASTTTTMPATTSVTSATAAAFTSAIFPTTNAFIQMNLTNNFTSGCNSTTIDITSSTITTTSSASLPFVDSYLLGMAWPKALILAIFLLLILVTVVGNTLVILSVLTTRRLRTVTNCFVMNLAITDWLVGTCVMPPAVILYIVGSWRFGWILCDIWISLDVLLCTSSILSLCAISLDRYLAVTQPLTYSKKRRSKRLALFMIFIVWVTALSITCPPYLGWYEPGRRQQGYVVCRYNQNKGYVVFSAMGSFFIPLAVMLYVYLKIGYVLTSRRQRMVRDANSERTADHEIDCDNFLSESEHFHCATPKFPSFKARWGSASNGGSSSCNSKTNTISNCSKCNKNNYIDQAALKHQASFYELVEISRLSSLIHCSAISCKFGGPCIHTTAVGVSLSSERRASTLPIQTLHYSESAASFSESCLTAATTTAAASATTAAAAAAAAQSAKFNQLLQQQHQQLQQHQSQHNHHHQQHPAHPHPHRIPMRVSTTKRDTKTAKTLTIVMGGFIACWLPFFIYYLLMPFLPPAARFEGLMSFLTWVGWVNCAINPFIYAFYNPDFRTAFWRLTCRRICKQKPPPNHMAMFRG